MGNKPRGPLVTEREYVPIEQVEGPDCVPSQVLSDFASDVVKQLVKKVGYESKITVVIEARPDYNAAIGFDIVAKTRLEL